MLVAIQGNAENPKTAGAWCATDLCLNSTLLIFFQVDVKIAPGTHASEEAVNKQLADKERVAAALENSHLLEVVNQCLAEPES